MTRKVTLILVLLFNLSFYDYGGIDFIATNNKEDDFKNIFYSPNGDYSINLGNTWQVTYQDSPDSSNIVISTKVINLENIQMLRIYRYDTNESSLEAKINGVKSRLSNFYKQIEISNTLKVNFLEYTALMIEYEYQSNSAESTIERAFIMVSENGNYYELQIVSTKNSNYKSNLNELEELIRTFKTK